MRQVYVEIPDRKTAFKLLWYATSCHIFNEQLRADFSEIAGSNNVDIELPDKHTAEELREILTELGFGDLRISPIPASRAFRSAETVRIESLHALAWLKTSITLSLPDGVGRKKPWSFPRRPGSIFINKIFKCTYKIAS